MPTDPQYALVYTAYGCEYVKVGTSFSPDVPVGQKVLKVYDINPETGELTEHGEPRPKVTVEQVREHVESLQPQFDPDFSGYSALSKVLNFIDNGPKKPTAEAVIEECIESDYQISGNRIARALREAGYLKDEA